MEKGDRMLETVMKFVVTERREVTVARHDYFFAEIITRSNDDAIIAEFIWSHPKKFRLSTVKDTVTVGEIIGGDD
jgi:hypothetical protein